MMSDKAVHLEQRGAFFIGKFTAMACPCEIMIETESEVVAEKLAKLAAIEAWRIEQKFSRYRNDNIIHRINNSAGNSVEVDEETARLLNFSEIAWQQSEGLFDITGGVFREIWNFKTDKIPDLKSVEKTRGKVGWSRISWQSPQIKLGEGMQIDLGGIGKEYAVDRVAQLCLLEQQSLSVLVNFGGDLCALKQPVTQPQWNIGIDNPYRSGQACLETIKFKTGGLATSGDARNFIEFEGKRYSHIINPATGYPAEDAPRSVTVHSDTCTQAGLFSTLSILQGKEAEIFLKQTECPYWISW